MRMIPAVSEVRRASGTLRALAITSLILGMGVETVGASWELRIDIPGASFQAVNDISSNRRFVVGRYCAEPGCSNFLWHRNELTTISIPGASETHLNAINASGHAVGFVWSPDPAFQFAFLRLRNGTIRRISCPFSTSLRPTAINDGGTVVGSWYNTDEDLGAFRWRNGRCEQLPLADGYVFPTDISANGIIVGGAGAREELDPMYAFMVRRNRVVVVEHPEALFENGGLTLLNAVAANGLAVGWTSPDIGGVIRGDIRWFVYRGGVFESFDVPGPREFRPLSISSLGVVTYVGFDNVIRVMRVRSALLH